MKKQNIALIVIGLALIVGFFLEWMMRKSGLDVALHSQMGWGRTLFFAIPMLGAVLAGVGLLDHKLRGGVAILTGLVTLGLTIYLWTKALPLDRIEFWIVVGAAAGSIYLIATKADTKLLAIPGAALVVAYFVPTITVPFALMVIGAALAIAGFSKHRTTHGLALALPIIVIAPLVQTTALVFRYQAKLGMWVVAVAGIAAIAVGIAAANKKTDS